MQFSVSDLYSGFNGRIPPLDMPTILYVIMILGIGMKFLLWIYCIKLNATLNSDSVCKLEKSTWPFAFNLFFPFRNF